MFGHGRQFKRGKWPATWYSALELVDTLGRYPEVWDGPQADPDDRRALAEVAACAVAYNFDEQGRRGAPIVFPGLRTALVRPEEGGFAVRDCKYVRRAQAVSALAGRSPRWMCSSSGSSKGGNGVVNAAVARHQ